MGGNALTPGRNTSKTDLVYTPPELAKTIIDNFPIAGKVLDPARGVGAFYDQFPSEVHKDWCEISEGRDFYSYTNTVDWLVTNPPWSHMRDWLRHSYTISENIVLLCPFVHFVTKARLKDMAEAGFGLKEFLCVKTPPAPWPSSGFQLGAMHLQKGYAGDLKIVLDKAPKD